MIDEEDDLQHFVLRSGLEEALRHRVLEHAARTSMLSPRSSVPVVGAGAARATPTPGLTMFTAIRPTTSASVVTTSK